MGRNAKCYIKEIAKALSLEKEIVGNMTLNEIDAIFLKQHNSRVDERIKTDLTNQKRIELLLNDYTKYISYLGDSFIRGLCQTDLVYYLDTYCDKKGLYDHDLEKKQYLEVKEEEEDRYYQRKTYYKLRMSRIGEAVNDAIIIKYPVLEKYCPSICYSYEGFHSFIDFIIETGKDEEGVLQKKQFSCSIESFLNKDIISMVEDYLQRIGYHRCKDRHSEVYIQTNTFLSSSYVQEFLQTIRELS